MPIGFIDRNYGNIYKGIIILFFLVLYFSVSCSFSSIEFAERIELTIKPHPENSLMALASIELDSEAIVSIIFSSELTATRQTSNSNWESTHEITVLGMRAETLYKMKAKAQLRDGSFIESSSVSFTTGKLAENVPDLTLIDSSNKNSGGITFFGIQSGRNWGVDEQGGIVWYLHGDYSISSAPVIREMGNGVLLVFLEGSIQTISTDGEIIRAYEINKWHHDARILPNENLMIIGFEYWTNEYGKTLAGDTITEISPDGDVVWEWSSFEHLDTSRILSNILTQSGKGIDWSHSNALMYIEEDDSILLSVRTQSWIIKIDHKTGDIKWFFGNDTDTDSSFLANSNFFSLDTDGEWMTNQHAAMITNNGDILVYDNRNESGGEDLNSRAVRYSIDISSMIAVQTWEAVVPKYTGSFGDVDELSNGDILICAGGPGSDENAYILEVSSDDTSEILWSIRIENEKIYRTERISWDSFLY